MLAFSMKTDTPSGVRSRGSMNPSIDTILPLSAVTAAGMTLSGGFDEGSSGSGSSYSKLLSALNCSG